MKRSIQLLASATLLPLVFSQCNGLETPNEDTDLIRAVIPNEAIYSANDSGDSYWLVAADPDTKEILAYGQAMAGDTLVLARPEDFTGQTVDLYQVFQVTIPEGFFGNFISTNVVVSRGYPTGAFALPESSDIVAFDRPIVEITDVPFEEGSAYAYALRSDQSEDSFDEGGSYSSFDEVVTFSDEESMSTTGLYVLSRRSEGDATPAWDYQILENITEDDGTITQVPNTGWQAASALDLSHGFTAAQAWTVNVMGITGDVVYPMARFSDEDAFTSLQVPTLPSAFGNHLIDFTAVIEESDLITTQFQYLSSIGASAVTIPSPTLPDMGGYTSSDQTIFNGTPISVSGTNADLYLLSDIFINDSFSLLTYLVNGDPTEEISAPSVAWPAEMTEAIQALNENNGYQLLAESLSLIEVPAYSSYADYLADVASGDVTTLEGERNALIFTKGN